MNPKAVTFLKQDPKLTKIIERVGNYQIKKRNNHFATLVESIISQQLASGAAEAILRRFKKLYPNFPKPVQILKTKDSKLRSVGLSKMKVEYLKDLAKKIEGGHIEIKSLSKIPDDKIIDELTQVKGIGVWTAPDVFDLFMWKIGCITYRRSWITKGSADGFFLTRITNPQASRRYR